MEKSNFTLGQIVVTTGVHSLMVQDVDFEKFIRRSLWRHANGDWGDLCEEDRKENEISLKEGFRLMSAYKTCPELDFRNGSKKIWVITEADRSATTVLFPEEY